MTKPLKIHFDEGDAKILCMRAAGRISKKEEEVTCCFCRDILKKRKENPAKPHRRFAF